MKFSMNCQSSPRLGDIGDSLRGAMKIPTRATKVCLNEGKCDPKEPKTF